MENTISEFPNAEIIKSPYELDFIRKKLSGILKDKIVTDGVLELILCLANEISDLKKEISDLKKEISERPKTIKFRRHY